MCTENVREEHEVIKMKPLLNTEQLIEHMKKKGIKFNIVNEEQAKDFLTYNNYYMKLASYRFNYNKYSAGKHCGEYIDLEFAYLKELSTIDMHLRYIICQMCLDIEHFLKVKLLNSIENNENEDGYRIIQKFIAKDAKLKILKKIQGHKSSDYCKGLIDKYHPYYPAWVFIELISFGDLAHLCHFYYELYDDKVSDHILLNSVRDIRNATAHSNCVINVLTPGNNRPHNTVKQRVKKIPSIGQGSMEKKLKNKCIYDFVCLLFAYDEIITSEVTKRKRYNELNEFFDGRMIRNKNWFERNQLLTSSYQFVREVIDYLDD